MVDLTLTYKDASYVFGDCDEGISRELSDYFTFDVPSAKFDNRYKFGKWDGKIRLWNKKTHLIYAGLYEKIKEFCKDRNYSYEFDDKLINTTDFSLHESEEFIKNLKIPKIIPRKDQIEGFVHAIRKKRCILQSPTGTGKSLLIYLLTRKFLPEGKIVIVVPNINLVDQLYGDFHDYGLDSEQYVHRIYSGEEKQTNKPIIISTWQSLILLPEDYLLDCPTVIGDECHRFKAKSLIEIMRRLPNAYNRIGTTGTLDDVQANKLVLEGLFGPINIVTTTKERMDAGDLAKSEIKCLILKHQENEAKSIARLSYQEEVKYIDASEKRNKFIKNLVLSLKGNVLVLFKHIEHGKALEDIIRASSPKIPIYYVDGGIKERDTIRKNIDSFKDSILLASMGTFSTGVNIKNLHHVVLASSTKSKINLLQSIGRGLRVSDNKDSVTIYDIVDDLTYKTRKNYTLKHFLERIKIYSKEQHKFVLYNIDLK